MPCHPLGGSFSFFFVFAKPASAILSKFHGSPFSACLEPSCHASFRPAVCRTPRPCLLSSFIPHLPPPGPSDWSLAVSLRLPACCARSHSGAFTCLGPRPPSHPPCHVALHTPPLCPLPQAPGQRHLPGKRSLSAHPGQSSRGRLHV